ncbi:M20 family metallopeptidase [Gordonia sp. zg691]|uniref:M20 family metallopeptidase n=1 Tax=Gordonia jinghuaiqii TaxID=2758710 RepID=A0A7D7R176_9ACTN|nr:M20 family metallopeptidase [Gordonia jinghuaiqii]MBD0860901.1 M20 family metallopeptidase [Gordonia jinghuaiqii]MCR5979539.1 ArgE/DapE family deacylase [Gordonia jinghuaiqii]QMT00667.1 M20 family metallopeptidase [Gordonia jinghuaiqii]
MSRETSPRAPEPRSPAGHVSARRVAELTARLVACNTTNPPGDERPIIAPLLDVLSELGCEITVFDDEPSRPSLVARYPGAPDGAPVLIINGHLDVVPVVHDQWEIDPFGGVIEGDRVRGRGSCDMKGGVAAAIEALRALRDSALPPSCVVELHLVADEETGSRFGTSALAAAGRIAGDACIIPEPNDLRVGVAERGTVMARITTVGTPAHGSDPAVGHSAIADAARIVNALHLRDFGGPPHPLLASPTCNVGTISGGSATNVVAGECTMTIDRRTLPNQTAADALAAVRSAIDELEPPVDYTLSPIVFVPASEIAPDHPFVELVSAAAAAHVGDITPAGSMLGSDARIMRNDLEIPTVVFGPGSPIRAHTSDEWVAVDDLVRAARTFADIFTTFGSARGR